MARFSPHFFGIFPFTTSSKIILVTASKQMGTGRKEAIPGFKGTASSSHVPSCAKM
jgi:hypothetical protein